MNVIKQLNRFLQRVHIQPDTPEKILSAEEINDFIQLKRSAQASRKQSQYSDARHPGQKLATRTGQGMDYTESRKYSAGDDYRSINWIQTARSQDLIVNVYLQENEVTDYILLDTRHPMYFGTIKQPKISVALKALISSVLDSLKRQHDINLIVFDNQKTQSHMITDFDSAMSVFNMLSDFSEEKIDTRNTNEQTLFRLIRFLQSIKPAYSNISIISDFHDINTDSVSALNIFSETNLLYLIRIIDRIETEIPDFYPVEYQSIYEDNALNLNSRKDVIKLRKHLKSIQSYTGFYLDQVAASIRTLLTSCDDNEIVN